MKKVLILCYYFPPSNLTASQKAFSWAKYLVEYGYYPIVITRNWDVKISSKYDVVKSSGDEIKHEKFDTYEVYYLPNRSTIQSYFFLRDQKKIFRIVSRALTFFTLVVQNYSTFLMPNKHIFLFAKEYLKKHKDVNKMVITGNPFIFFKIGYLLNTIFGIKWVADYRDMWTTQELHDSSRENKLFRWLNNIEKRSEKLWVNSAERITSVSEHYASKIGNFVQKKHSVVPNGYFHEEFKTLAEGKSQFFTICYSGTLYDAQNIEILIEAYKRFIDSRRKSIKTKLIFIGTAYKKEQKVRIESLINGYQEFVEVTNRIPRIEALSIQKKAHLLLLFPYEGASSVIPSKIYEYIGLKTPILMVPSDKDIVEQMIQKNKLGFSANTIEQTTDILESAYQLFLKDSNNTLPINENISEKFTRRYSTKLMADILNRI